MARTLLFCSVQIFGPFPWFEPTVNDQSMTKPNWPLSTCKLSGWLLRLVLCATAADAFALSVFRTSSTIFYLSDILTNTNHPDADAVQLVAIERSTTAPAWPPTAAWSFV
jgi:hypothetical protein